MPVMQIQRTITETWTRPAFCDFCHIPQDLAVLAPPNPADEAGRRASICRACAEAAVALLTEAGAPDRA